MLWDATLLPDIIQLGANGRLMLPTVQIEKSKGCSESFLAPLFQFMISQLNLLAFKEGNEEKFSYAGGFLSSIIGGPFGIITRGSLGQNTQFTVSIVFSQRRTQKRPNEQSKLFVKALKPLLCNLRLVAPQKIWSQSIENG